jgi:hypothetical protein
MGRFEPSADPRDAVERGFYVPRPGRSLAEQLAARFELKPTASHLLVGGVGSGKTTQLLVARDRLEAVGDVRADYVDVSRFVEPNHVTSRDLLDAIELEDLLFPVGTSAPHRVLLIDSLDRISDLDRFVDLIEGTVSALRSSGIGVILVGPLAALYGIGRVTQDRFDRIWHLPTVDVQNDAEGHEFLLRVLHARDSHGLLTDGAAERLATLSGGVLRDLIALTQAAGEEAYVDGANHVDVKHVEIAAEFFGRKHLFAIDSAQLAVLQRVRTHGTFVQTSEKDLALLATRRVLEYDNGKPRFAVHPTIESLLAQLPEVA